MSVTTEFDENYPHYADKGGIRVMGAELEELFFAETGCVPVRGFLRTVENGGFVCNHTSAAPARFAGFMESNGDTKEYILGLNSEPGEIITAPVKLRGDADVAFYLSFGFGNGSELPQPSGRFDVYLGDRYLLSIKKVNYSFSWRVGDCAFHFSMRRLETAPAWCGMRLSDIIHDEGQAAFGIGVLRVPAALLRDGESAVIRFVPRGEYPSTRYIYLSDCPNLLSQANITEAVRMLKGGIVRRSAEYNVYFGDIHTHSGQVRADANNGGCGMGSMEENYRYARDVSSLDFYALTDHEWQILPDYEDNYFALADKYNEDGRFVTLRAYEHTSPAFGHRIIYFNGRSKVVPNREDGVFVTPDELFRRLEGYNYISIPHHPSSASHPCNIRLIGAHDSAVEIYSTWGSSERWGEFPRGVSDRNEKLYVSELLRQRDIIGFVAGADGHDGHPGDAQSPYPKHQHQFHFCGSGLTAALCDSLTRDEIFGAIKARRTYATTGAPILLSVTHTGRNAIGRVFPRDRSPILDISVTGTDFIDEVAVYKNGEPVMTERFGAQKKVELTFRDNLGNNESANYYVRIKQRDRECAWSSPCAWNTDEAAAVNAADNEKYRL